MAQSGSQPLHSTADGKDAGLGQVLPFRRPERTLSGAGHGALAPDAADQFAQFEQEPDEPVDYRQRMLMNVIAVAIVTLLVTSGVWIADTIAQLQRDQDCILQGRSNCLPISVPTPKRR